MNTNPDEANLALWLDDELEGAELASFEAWTASQPEHLAAREETRRWRKLISGAIPQSEEPPFPDFFNSRIAQGIREQTPALVLPEKKTAFWKSWLMPMAACAGMVFAFWIGAKSETRSIASQITEFDVAGAPRAIPVEQIIYTPENGVNAELFASDLSSPMVIVLSGMAAIPDTMDFSATTYIPREREFNSTADFDSSPAEVTN